MIPAIITSSAKACVLLVCFSDMAYPVGGWQGDWKQLDKCVGYVKPGQKYQLFTVKEKLRTKFLVKDAPTTAQVRDEMDETGYIPTEALSIFGHCEQCDYSGVNLATNCPARIRTAKLLNPKDQTYRKIARDFLDSKGVPEKAPMFIREVLQIDLDNDGVKELIITVQTNEMYDAMPDYDMDLEYYYCYIFMRKKDKNGKVKTTVLFEDRPSQLQIEAGDFITSAGRVIGFIDLNNDGITEIVMQTSFFEGWEVYINQLDQDGNLEPVSGVGEAI